MTPQRSGFTLIELLVVIALVVLVSMERSGGGGTGSSPLLPVDCLYVFCI
jgi:prepilin-type N-terminal cleavage/methylation domain-containing protein